MSSDGAAGLTQFNLQTHFGGGEVYTAFLCRALAALGRPTRLVVHPRAAFWHRLDLPADTVIVPAGTAPWLTGPRGWLLGHGPLPTQLLADARRQGWLATAVAHMPVQGRDPRAFAGHDLVFAVSGWVLAGLQAAGLPAWPEPLYGVAESNRGGAGAAAIRRRSRYDWDRRKFRDRLFSWIEPAAELLRPHPGYDKRPGLTLGIVSRLTPIKQFPLLFERLAPVLARFPGVHLEIFGSGGYGSVRDLARALRPLAGRVRFWGHQANVAAVYRGIDYLMTGLPEKEALGLNVIEAQACGTPVLAPNAAPFTETVVDGATGFLYCDPRIDQGEDFGRLLGRLASVPRPDPRQAAGCMDRFSFAAFVERLKPVIRWADDALSEKRAAAPGRSP
ncbi:MAG: glycosyltransferase family 4 protein [Rhodocyclaceae bacterium]|nr:glycosyltransferase family 4 protein [Rhodocyclaceae bacterium]